MSQGMGPRCQGPPCHHHPAWAQSGADSPAKPRARPTPSPSSAPPDTSLPAAARLDSAPEPGSPQVANAPELPSLPPSHRFTDLRSHFSPHFLPANFPKRTQLVPFSVLSFANHLRAHLLSFLPDTSRLTSKVTANPALIFLLNTRLYKHVFYQRASSCP